MATTTPLLGLRKPDDVAPNDDLVDVTLDISDNMDKIDELAKSINYGAFLSSPLTVNNTTSFIDIPGVSITIPPGSYRFTFNSDYDASTVADVKFRFVKTGAGSLDTFAGAVVRVGIGGTSRTNIESQIYTAEDSSSFIAGGVGVGTRVSIIITGTIIVSGGSITLQAQFAQNVAEVSDATCRNNLMTANRFA